MELRQGEFLIGMWHYIVPPEGLPFNLSGETCELENFKNQLKKIQEKFTIRSLADIMTYIGNDKKVPDNSLVLAFDDGAKGHYEIVFPLLKAMGLPANFAVMAGPLQGKIPATFMLQLLAGAAGGEQLRNEIFPKAMESIGRSEMCNKIEVPEKRYRFETQPVREVKYVCNFLLPPQQKDKVVGMMFDAIFPQQEAEIAKKMFLTAEEIKAMAEGGMEIQSHGIGHHLMSLLDEESLKEELASSKKILESIVGREVYSYIYPSALPEQKDKVKQAVIAAGYRCGQEYDAPRERKTNPFPYERFLLQRIHERLLTDEFL